MKKLLILIGFILIMGTVQAVPQTISVQGFLKNTAGTLLTGSYNFSFRIYTAYTGGTEIYEDNQSLTTNVGIYSTVLNDVDIDFSQQYYLGVNVQDDGEMSPRINLTTSPYAFRSNYTQFIDGFDSTFFPPLNKTLVEMDEVNSTTGNFTDIYADFINGFTSTGDVDMSSNVLYGATNINGTTGNFTDTYIDRVKDDLIVVAGQSNLVANGGGIVIEPYNATKGTSFPYARLMFNPEKKELSSSNEPDVILSAHNWTAGGSDSHHHFSIYTSNSTGQPQKRLDLTYLEDIATWNFTHLKINFNDQQVIGLTNISANMGLRDDIETIYGIGGDFKIDFQSNADKLTFRNISNEIILDITQLGNLKTRGNLLVTAGKRFGIGDDNPSQEIDIDDGGGVSGTPTIAFNSERGMIGYNGTGGNLLLYGGGGKGIEFRANGGTMAVEITGTGDFDIFRDTDMNSNTIYNADYMNSTNINATQAFLDIIDGFTSTGDIHMNLGTELNASEINEVLYVQSGNVTDIQVKIDLNPSTSGGTTVVVPSGNYALDAQQNLTSNLTLIINKGASIYWNTDGKYVNYTDHLSKIYTTMFHGEGLENVNIINYGILEPRKIWDTPGSQDGIIYFNNSDVIDIYGGYLKSSHEGFGIFNSNNTHIHDIYSDNLTSVPVWFECVMDSSVSDIKGESAEAVDLNAYCENIQVYDINLKTYDPTDNEIVDVNAGKNILINNILGTNTRRLVSIVDTIVGTRFGTCSGFTGTNVTASDMQCYDCTDANSFVNTTNSRVEELVNGKMRIQQRTVGTYITQDSETSGTNYGLWIHSNVEQDNNELVKITQDHSSSSKQALQINNDGTGIAVAVDQNGNGISFLIDSEATTQPGIDIRMASADYDAIIINDGRLNMDSNYIIWGTSGTRPTATEGVCYWNTTAGYKCQQCYNSTDWVGLGCVNCNGVACT